MAQRRVSTAGVLLLCVVATSFSWASGAAVLSDEEEAEPRRVPLYVYKARLYLKRQKAYERTMQARMETLTRALDSFTSRLYLQHVEDNAGGNVLLSPLSAYVSLAMALTASLGTTKREILASMGLAGESRGIHTSVQRALKSLHDDDTDDVNNDLGAARDLSGMQSDEPGIELSYQDLENIIRNDYLMDSSISYNTGQTHIKYSTAVKTSAYQGDDPSPLNSEQPVSDLFIRIANGMFHSEQVALSQQFSNRLVSLYGAPPMAMQQIQPEVSVNLWVDAVTRGTVPDMLAPDNVSNETLLVLVNALSFWGSWETNFDEKETIPLEFQTQDGDSVLAQSMYRTGNYSVKNLHEVGAKVLELPYSNMRYSLFVFLPDTSVRLRDLERGLKTHGLQTLLHDMPEPSMTIVLLPRFHLRSRVSLSSELRRQGIQRLFKERKADLKRMTDEDKSSLFVNDFFQYAAFEVNEGKRSDAGKKSITIGSGWDTSGSTILDSGSNSSNHIHISDIDDELSEIYTGEKAEELDNQQVHDDDFEDYDYEENEYYDYEEGDGSKEESGNYFIADRPFFFVVKDKQYDLILLLGRVTNPLP